MNDMVGMHNMTNDDEDPRMRFEVHQQQQQEQHEQREPSRGDVVETALLTPSDTMLTQFRTDVKNWIDTDNAIKRLAGALKERRTAKRDLTGRILRFMETYNVEDLNTREGRLRYRVSNVFSPLGQKAIKQRLQDFIVARFGEDVFKEATSTIFAREQKEKTTLCRFGRSLTLM
jgi:hypothetical protein